MVKGLLSLFRLLPRGRGDVDCKEVRKHSSDYLEGELPDSLVERFRFHLARCKNCNAFVATLKATVNTLRGLPRREPPSGLEQRILRMTTRPGNAQGPSVTKPGEGPR